MKRMSLPLAAALCLPAVAGTIVPTAGVLTGTWENTTFSSAGSLSFGFEVVGSDFTVTLDLDGNVFGGADPGPLVLTGMFTDAAGNGTFAAAGHPTYGDVSGTLGTFTQVEMLMQVNRNGILDTVIEGALTPAGAPTEFDGTYRVNFTEAGSLGGGAEGEDFALGTLSAVPEPAVGLLAALGLSGWLRRRRR